MKKILDIEFGFADAENYKRRENKQLLNKVFIKNVHLENLLEPSISFLIGEKGTGKTAYAVYLSNNNYKETNASIRYIRETEYQKFISLKTEKHLNLSDYSSIWKAILYLLLSRQICEKEGGETFLKRFSKLHEVQQAIDEYYNKAFSPEIIQALNFIQESKIAAEIMAKYAKAGTEEKNAFTFSESRFQTNLFYIQKRFETALEQVRLVHSHILFIDGIDIRPSSIPYSEYLECIKGLANAVWEANNDFFPTIKGSRGRLKVVLLIRPDIFDALGLQNQNTKLRDNSVFLDWRTEYINHRKSDLFKVVDRLLASGQPAISKPGEAWNYYFDWNAPNVGVQDSQPTSFISFLRWSYYRPRDIITMLELFQGIAKEQGIDKDKFEYKDFEDPKLQRQYSNYLLGELKDHLVFYYGRDEYEIFLKFFKSLNGKSHFDYNEYDMAFSDFSSAVKSTTNNPPKFMSSANSFLQFLFDLNVICYIERTANESFIRWCFRERNYANISPKVKEGLTYQVFYGLRKALNLGNEFT